MNPFYSMRLGETHQTDLELLSRFLELWKRNPGSCDEVWFATWYGYPTVATHVRLAKMITRAAEMVRSRGIGVSLQISNTIGHGEYTSVRDFSGFGFER